MNRVYLFIVHCCDLEISDVSAIVSNMTYGSLLKLVRRCHSRHQSMMIPKLTIVAL